MGLARGAGSVIIWREGTPFEAMTGRATYVPPYGFLTEVFRGFPQS